jgi:hyperosmotically inducible periplasmic protein
MNTCTTKTLAVFAAVIALSITSFAQDADNTKKNERDRDAQNAKPTDQSNTPEDLQLVKSIRQAVVGEKSLTATAKNIKIITSGGKVTLRGPVNSAEEKSKIEAIATTAAGEGKVHSLLEIKAAK